MKKLKLLAAVALVTISGAALAGMIDPLYNPAIDPSTGGYTYNCGAAYFYDQYGGAYFIPAMQDGQSTPMYLGQYRLVSCSYGTVTVSGDYYEGSLSAA